MGLSYHGVVTMSMFFKFRCRNYILSTILKLILNFNLRRDANPSDPKFFHEGLEEIGSPMTRTQIKRAQNAL
ncbi:hypothetical protein Lal_00015830 [Lupinus albus]|nr:hypothetical protein Lal_00015830 [Lupinus albus]